MKEPQRDQHCRYLSSCCYEMTSMVHHVAATCWSVNMKQNTVVYVCDHMPHTQVRGSQCNCYLASTCRSICCRDVSSMRCWFHSHRPVWRQLPVSLVCAWCGSSASLQWECPPRAPPQRLRSPVSERKSAMKIHSTWYLGVVTSYTHHLSYRLRNRMP